jgi:tRNA pseudouridine32 synthase / 23S rRNA pseudouridine746 synthase
MPNLGKITCDSFHFPVVIADGIKPTAAICFALCSKLGLLPVIRLAPIFGLGECPLRSGWQVLRGWFGCLVHRFDIAIGRASVEAIGQRMHIDIESLVLHRDENIIILNKPAGIAVHAGRGDGPNLEARFGPLQGNAKRVPALAHRLDKETSGCLVLGRSDAALKRLGLLFREGFAEKTYLATVLGVPPEAGAIAHPLGRASNDKRSWVMKVRSDGDPSLTQFVKLAQGDGIAALQLSPKTGRTHQLRVHCASEGFPICGDRLYGGDRALAAARHLQLHAWRIVLPFDRRNPISVAAPIPDHMTPLLAMAGFAA